MTGSELGTRTRYFLRPHRATLAKLTPEIPDGSGWLYEPKWDGFRCIVYFDGANDPYLQSRDLRGESRKG